MEGNATDWKMPSIVPFNARSSPPVIDVGTVAQHDFTDYNLYFHDFRHCCATAIACRVINRKNTWETHASGAISLGTLRPHTTRTTRHDTI